MNVIVANERAEELNNLDIEIIKSLNGEYQINTLIDTFKYFYYNKLIIDITSIKDYMNFSNLQLLSTNIDPNKIILLLPDSKECSNKNFLERLISIGIYNFTNNINGVKYLVSHTNTLDDVNYVYNMEDDTLEDEEVSTGTIHTNNSNNKIIGVKNITDHAGATTFIYMMKKELEKRFGDTVYAVEINRHDFEYFNVKNTISTNKINLMSTISKINDATVIFVDLNDMVDYSMCDEVLYLIEPSSIMLNKLMRTNKNIFSELDGKKIILNKSMLSSKDISELEYETKTHVFYNVPSLNDRKKSDEIVNVLTKLGFFDDESNDSKLFGLFKI